MQSFHSLSTKAVLESLNSGVQGLSEAGSRERLNQYGLNELSAGKKISAWKIFFSQFNNALLLLLILAALISLFMGESTETIAIAGILLLNTILGFTQEYRANREMQALENLSSPTANILREGEAKKIDAREIVPGDILLLEAGDIVSADARLFEASSLKVDESSLTGESVPAEKETEELPEDTRVSDRNNMVYFGTAVTYGRGRAVVTATGSDTEFGHIAHTLQETEEVKTPLQKKFARLAKQIGLIVIVLIALVLTLGVLQKSLSFGEMLLFALALTVSTIPNSLPIIVTVGLSLGARYLARKNMLIRKLPAAESLGAATMIVSDKTGTITRNEMTVTDIWFAGEFYSVTGSGYASKGEIRHRENRIDPQKLEPLIRVGAVCNNALVQEREGKFELTGDPTEGALVTLAAKSVHRESEWKEKFQLMEELPFDSDRKRMSVVTRNVDTGEKVAFVKGAPDHILHHCTHLQDEQGVRELKESDKEEILKINAEFGSRSLRVLALAERVVDEGEQHQIDSVENNLIFLGLVGMIDPPRDEVREAVSRAREAGIGTMVITGDHADTARAVAREIGLYREGDIVLTGSDLDNMSDDDLEKNIDRIRIIARALPIQKSRIVDILQKKGHVVAMTGDGVNDALALKKADIGISMGITGSDITKEVSRAMLVDDNFATIVNAIEEGRNIYNKMIISAKYLLSCNVGEITVVLSSLLLGLPLPLLPLQILLMNLLTDDFPALGLGFEKGEKDIMKLPPRNPREAPLNRTMFLLIVIFGLIMGLGTLLMFLHYREESLALAQTIAFTTLVMFQLFAVLSSRTLYFSLRSLNPFSNPWLLGAVLLSLSIQFAVIYIPVLQKAFGTVSLSPEHWLQVVAVASLGMFMMEASKLLLPRAKRNTEMG